DDHHVGTLDQATHDRRALVAVGVDGDAALAAVEAEEGGRMVAFLLRAPVTRAVARGALDLDHVRAGVAEHVAAVRARDALGELDDRVSLEWPRHRALPSDVLAEAVVPRPAAE